MRLPCNSCRYAGSIRLFLATLLAAWLNVPAETKAQTPGISGVSVVFQRVSSEQGLSNNSVWAITQDKQGFIWFGTENGLNRFDGRRCVVYYAAPDSTGLSDNWVWSLFCDKDNSLWIGTNRGLNRFDPRTLTFKKYLHDSADHASLSHNEVSAILRDEAGILWVGTKRGLNKFESETGTWTHFLPTPGDPTRPGDNFIRAILEDDKGSIWVESGNYAMNGGGIFNFDRERGSFSPIEARDTKSFHDGFIASRSVDTPGNFWVCASDRYGPESSDQWSGTMRGLRGEKLNGNVTNAQRKKKRTTRFSLFKVSEDRHGAIWGVGDGWGGLDRYEMRTGRLTRYTGEFDVPNSLSSKNISEVFIDRAGLLWIGTNDGGVNTVSTKPFLSRHTLGDSLRIANPFGLTFVDKQGNVWNGSLRFDAATKRAMYSRLGVSASDFCQDTEGTVWASHPYGLVRCVPGTDVGLHTWRLPLAGLDEVATCVYVDSRGLFWVGTQGGVYRLSKDLSEYTRFNLDPENVGGIFGGRVTSIYEDTSGTIWVGTGTGLNEFPKGMDTFRHFVHDEGDSTSLSSNYCSGICEDMQGRLWVSTALGLDQYNPASRTFTRYLHQPAGRIVADRRGRFWFGATAKALGPAGKLRMYDPVAGQLLTFDASDGLPSEEIFGWPNTMLKSGELVFGTNKGFVVFHPDSVKELAYVPPVIITGIRMFEKPVSLKTAPELLREISFEHDENVLSISYAALSYDMPEFNQYAYKLDGFDKDWVNCGNKQEVTFTNLDPGEYAFRVKGSNHDGVWNEAGATLAIAIRPAYWQTWWFKGLMVIAMVGLGGSVVGYAERARGKRKIERLEREHALERERARISQDMHDEVGSSLSEIAILSELVKRDLRKPEMAEVQVQQISDRAAELIDNVSEIVWAMNPKNDTLDSLLGHIRRYAVKYLDLAGIGCEFHVPEMIPPVPVPSDIRRNLFLVVKEALHNILKHACASAVTISVQSLDETMRIQIQDNGQGFVQSEKMCAGNGLLSMRKRIADIDGEIQIESTPGSGTRISVAVPLTDLRRSP